MDLIKNKENRYLNFYSVFCIALVIIGVFYTCLHFSKVEFSDFNVLEFVVYMIVVLLPLFLIGYYGIRSVLKENKNRKFKISIICTSLFIVFVGSILMMYIKSHDYTTFLKLWYDAYSEGNIIDALGKILETSNYSPIYNYWLIICAQLHIPAILGIKYFTFLFSLLLSFVVTKIICFINKEKFNYVLFSIIMIVPCIFIEYTSWGQCDAIYTSLALLGFYFALKKKSKLSFMFIGLSFAFKLQFLFIVPVMFLMLILKDNSGEKYLKWKDLWIATLMYVVNLLPVIAGESLVDLVLVYFNQASYDNRLSGECANLCYLVQCICQLLEGNGNVDASNTIYTISLYSCIIITIVILVLLLVHFIKKYKTGVNPNELVFIGLLFSFVMVFFMPKMLDRFYYIAVMLSIVNMMVNRDKINTVICLLMNMSLAIVMTGFILMNVSFAIQVINMSVAIVAMIAALVLVFVKIMRKERQNLN